MTPNQAKKVLAALESAQGHLDYCGYGDAWESQARGILEPDIDAAIEAGYKVLGELSAKIERRIK